jgi:hypothetical protein
MNNQVEKMVEILLKKDDDFLKIKETLTRIGVASKKTNTLFQSCHILHKQGKYYIVHFKELFGLDNKPHDFTKEDQGRRNCIAKLLTEWGLLTLVKPDMIVEPMVPVSKIKIIPHKEKTQWELVAKYNIGKKIN